MSQSRAKRLGFWALLLGLAFPAACGSSGVVGGQCSASHIDCNGQCVDAQNDANNCGGCGRKCKAGVSCEDALCDGVPAGGGGGGGNGGASGNSGDGGSSADSGEGGSSAAAGADDDAGNLTDAHPDGDAGCSPPYNTAAACGECRTPCPDTKPNCAPYGEGEYVCVATCEAPLVACNGQCVDASGYTTPDACGGCDVKCPANKPFCSPDSQGSYVCKSLCDAPLVECNGQCVEPVFDTPEACGACNAACPTARPTCSPDGASHKCVLVCPDPLKECNGQCVDFNIDANNCGSCGNVCASGICQGGMCVGAYDGNIMLACMNYQTPMAGSPQTVLMGNAVFLTLREPVRILAYTEFASAESRAKVDQDIAFAASARQRTFNITPLSKYTSASAALNITKYDVFLIYDQMDAPTGELATVGAAWEASSVLDSFAAAGGMIIGLSGGTSEMDQFFSASGLLDVSGQTPVATGATLYKSALGGVLGANLISPFAAPADSCAFTTSVAQNASTFFVVRNAPVGSPGEPVVVHRVIAAP